MRSPILPGVHCYVAAFASQVHRTSTYEMHSFHRCTSSSLHISRTGLCVFEAKPCVGWRIRNAEEVRCYSCWLLELLTYLNTEQPMHV